MNYQNKKYNELKDFCKSFGLPTSGKTADLIKRLEEHDRNKGQQLFNEPELPLPVVNEPAESYHVGSSYFIQLKSSNLANYFNFGIIYPLALEESLIYKNENRAKDIFTVFPEHILLFKSPTAPSPDDVLVEIIPDDLSIEQVDDLDVYYILQPIPISRIKTILFANSAAKATFLSSVKIFPDAHVPASICKIAPENLKQADVNLSILKLPNNELLSKWKDKIDCFDKVMGMFAFMKNAGAFYAERENHFWEYTQSFFSALHVINKTTKLSGFKESGLYRFMLLPKEIELNTAQRNIFKLTLDRIYANETFDLLIAKDILLNTLESKSAKEEEKEELYKIIDLFTQLQNYKIAYKELLNQEIIKRNWPVLALLFISRFPNKSRQHTDKQSVRINFIENETSLNKNIAEFILAVLGLYYGYKTLIKEDTNLKFNDKTFEHLARERQSIKFRLDSFIDRFVIESVFMFVSKEAVVNDEFAYLRQLDYKQHDVRLIHSSWGAHDYIEEHIRVLDTKLVSVRRESRIEKTIEKIARKYPEEIEDNAYLMAFIRKYVKWNKSLVIDLLRKNPGKYPIDELERIIDLDKNKRP